MVRQSVVLVLISISLFISGCAGASKPKEPEGNQQIMVLQSEAETAYKMAMLDKAESLYIEVLTSVPNYAPAWFRLGNIYTRTGRQEAAISAYSKCLELEPDNQKAWYNISLVRIKQSTQVLSTASRQGNLDSPVGRQIKGLLDALNNLQKEPVKSNNQIKAAL
ncbi:tetratricopeptide repeat protein [Shewanella olleyana]|uniref:tetratricopeptide repeat protein n=1 Tax=Shewanella olleyana TaxID=135626 RepID=UPI00200C00C8|nr:tetratricopeptide repeat protein [Shewanella olleyana]MCL1066074.1 tetratricopeptide repeat protein [Shewanella olleyana]